MKSKKGNVPKNPETACRPSCAPGAEKARRNGWTGSKCEGRRIKRLGKGDEKGRKYGYGEEARKPHPAESGSLGRR